MHSNTDTVMSIYAAFGRGDVAFILDQMSDDIRWDHGLRDTGLTYLRPGTGTQHAAEFFKELMAQVEFTTFEPQTPCSSADTVMVPILEAGRNLTTGAEIPEDLVVHLWTFGPDGKAVAFRHLGDLWTHEAAARAVPATAASQ